MVLAVPISNTPAHVVRHHLVKPSRFLRHGPDARAFPGSSRRVDEHAGVQVVVASIGAPDNAPMDTRDPARTWLDGRGCRHPFCGGRGAQ